MLSALVSYSLFQRAAAPAAEAQPSADPAVEAEIAYWRENAPNVRSLIGFLDDDRLVAFASKAFGYGDAPPNKGLLGIALEQGAADAMDYANRAPDYRLEAMVRAFGFAEFGLGRLQDGGFVESVARRFRAQSAEARAAPDPVTANTAKETYFRNKIGSVTSAAELVADLGLYDFALDAFGLQDRRGERFMIEQALAQGIGEADDLANRLGDERLQAMAGLFGFGETARGNTGAENFAETVIRRFRAAAGQIEAGSREGETGASRYFRERIGGIGGAEDLLEDPRLYDYVMTAFDLSGETSKRGIVRQILTEGVSEEGSFGNRLSDPRYAEMARVLGLAEYGTRNVQDPLIIDEIVARYERVQREIEVGQQSPAAELAAYFDRKSGEITRWIDVVADSRLRGVAMTALGMPQAMAGLSATALADAFAARFDVEDLADPAKREGFIKRYLVLSDANSGGGAADPVLTLFRGGGLGATDNLYALVARL